MYLCLIILSVRSQKCFLRKYVNSMAPLFFDKKYFAAFLPPTPNLCSCQSTCRDFEFFTNFNMLNGARVLFVAVVVLTSPSPIPLPLTSILTLPPLLICTCYLAPGIIAILFTFVSSCSNNKLLQIFWRIHVTHFLIWYSDLSTSSNLIILVVFVLLMYSIIHWYSSPKDQHHQLYLLLHYYCSHCHHTKSHLIPASLASSPEIISNSTFATEFSLTFNSSCKFLMDNLTFVTIAPVGRCVARMSSQMPHNRAFPNKMVIGLGKRQHIFGQTLVSKKTSDTLLRSFNSYLVELPTQSNSATLASGVC